MKTIGIDAGTYILVMKMAKAVGETSEYILYRSVMREYVRGDEYHTKAIYVDEGDNIDIEKKANTLYAHPAGLSARKEE